MNAAIEHIDLDRTLEIERAAKYLDKCAQMEGKCKEERIQAELALIDLLGVKEEGSATTCANDVTVTITGALTRKVDAEGFQKVKNHLPPSYQDVIELKLEPKLNLKRLREMQTHEPDAYGMLAQCITTTPRKPSVKVKVGE